MTTYKLVRFFTSGTTYEIAGDMSLAEAQAWCKREDTHGEGWFDGYEEEASYISGDDFSQERGGATLELEPESPTALSMTAGIPVLFYGSVA